MNKAREEIIDRLGGVCKHCGYNTDKRVLQVDHVHNDGAEHRKQLGTGSHYWASILYYIDSGYYQLLCANCNIIKEYDRRKNTAAYAAAQKEDAYVAINGNKFCVKCRESKEIAMFYARTASKDKLDNYCKACRNSYKFKNLGNHTKVLMVSHPGWEFISPEHRTCAEGYIKHGLRVFTTDGDSIWRWGEWEKPVENTGYFKFMNTWKDKMDWIGDKYKFSVDKLPGLKEKEFYGEHLG